MNLLDQAIGITLLHSLWEGAVVALALAVVLSVARSSRVRYAAACAAMLALLAGFGVTFYRLMPRHSGGAAVVRILPTAVSSSSAGGPDSGVYNWDAAQLLPWLAPLWMAGVLLFQLRCLAAWMAAARLRRIGVCGAPEEWFERLDALRSRLRMTKPVLLLESCLADVPVVIGHLRPVVLVPVGLLTGLPIGQVEAVLLHELAHIRRGDYLVNLLQNVVEGLLFYHPAVWWISATIRAERENCCDDLVVATSGDAHEYATALAALAESHWAARDAVLAATGGNLVKRVRRLLAAPEGPRTAIVPVVSAGILVVTCGIALAAWQSPQQSSPAIAPVIPVAPVPSIKLAARAQAAAPVASPEPAAQSQVTDSRLDTAYKRWLKEDVAYIITDEERKAFKAVATDDEREQFIKQFWLRRDPTPGTEENEYREEHYRRIAYVNERFGTKTTAGWKTDRGRIYIQYGPPVEIDAHPNGGAYTHPPEQGGAQTNTYPFEQWRYRWIEGAGENVAMDFVDMARDGEYRLTMDPSEKDVDPNVRISRIHLPRGASLTIPDGPGPKAKVLITKERMMTVIIPIPFDAVQYLITESTVSSDGKTNLGSSQILANSCKSGPTVPGCLQDELRTTGTIPVPPGSYTFTAVVKDTAGSAEKTYVVNFNLRSP